MKTIALIIIASLLCAMYMTPASTAENAADPAVKYLNGRLAAAEGLLRDEQYAKALEIADALQALSPDRSFTQKVAGFRHRAIEARMRSEVLECRIVPDKEIYVGGDTVRLSLRIYNRSLGNVRIPLNEDTDSSPGKTDKRSGRLLITITARDFDTLGSVLTNTRVVEEIIEEEINLAPGDFWETTIEPEGLTNGVGAQVSRTIDLSATIAPVIIMEGDESRLYSPYRSAVYKIMVVPPNARTALNNPRAALEHTLEAGDAPGVFHASMLLAWQERNRALRMLAAALRTSRPNSAVERAIIVGMQHNVGVYRRRTRDSWLKWWNKAWTYYCVDGNKEDKTAVRITLVKTGGEYLIAVAGEKCGLQEALRRAGEAALKGATRAEIRCGRDVALAQFMELYAAVRSAGLKDIVVQYAAADKP